MIDSMILVIAFAMLPTNAQIERVFEACLRGRPISGHRFRVGAAEAIYKLGIGRRDHEPEFEPLAGDPASRICFTGDDAIQVMLSKRGVEVTAKCLPRFPEDFRLTRYAVSGGRLLAVYDEGGTGISLRGVVYKPTRTGWRHVYALDEYCELSMQGYNLEVCELKNPPGLQVRFTDHEMLDKYFSESHFAPGLKYAEVWRFTHGVLRRAVFYRVATPMAKLYDMKVAAVNGRRKTFDSLVPKRFQERLWNALRKGNPSGISWNSEQPELRDNDDYPDLVVDQETEVKFANRHGNWTITSVIE